MFRLPRRNQYGTDAVEVFDGLRIVLQQQLRQFAQTRFQVRPVDRGHLRPRRAARLDPVQALAKQKLLELDDPVSRLEILFTYLAQRKLVI